MTDALVETVRLRGPHAARLARVAAAHLPAALDRALSGLAPGRVDNINVTLDFDIDGIDDETIAAIWAHEVLVEVARHLPTAMPADPGDPGDAAPRSASAAVVTVEEALAAALLWLATPTPRGPVPVAALTLAAIVADNPDAAWTRTARVRSTIRDLDKAMARPRLVVHNPSAVTPVEAPTGRPPWEPPTVGPNQANNVTETPPAQRSPTSALPTAGGASRADQPEDASFTEATRRLTVLTELVGGAHDAARSLDVNDLTTAAGLAVIYPWLADVCRVAESLHPGLDPAEVRTYALAALVDPADEALTDDPLVRVLAGVRPESAAAGRIRLPQADAVIAEADRALESFASLLPGFESSSPEFVRREWMVRAGLLEQDRDPIRLTAASHPLDVVLTRLPYPVSLFKLPWSHPIIVRFRP